MSTKLKPCPFCGEPDMLFPAYHGMGHGKPYAIDCIGCGFDFVPREGRDVIAAWNRRDGYGLRAIIKRIQRFGKPWPG